MTLLVASLLLVPPLPAQAAVYNNGTGTTTFTVTLVITAGCTVAATPMSFGTLSNLNTAQTTTSTVSVTCTNTTPYNVGLSAGSGTGSTVTARVLTGAASGNTSTIAYGLYQDSGHATVWGTTQGTNTQAGTGNGIAQAFTVYGQLPVSAGAIPQPDTYTSVITATVYF
nr:spore coat protein U domain-containing protein [Pandoraea iniqua]